jgi:hypothetical protein
VKDRGGGGLGEAADCVGIQKKTDDHQSL